MVVVLQKGDVLSSSPPAPRHVSRLRDRSAGVWHELERPDRVFQRTRHDDFANLVMLKEKNAALMKENAKLRRALSKKVAMQTAKMTGKVGRASQRKSSLATIDDVHVHSSPAGLLVEAFAKMDVTAAVVETMEPTVSLSLDDLKRFPGVMHAYPATVRTTDEPVVVAVHRDVSVGQFPSQVSSDDGGRRIVWANPAADSIRESVDHDCTPVALTEVDRVFAWDASTKTDSVTELKTLFIRHSNLRITGFALCGRRKELVLRAGVTAKGCIPSGEEEIPKRVVLRGRDVIVDVCAGWAEDCAHANARFDTCRPLLAGCAIGTADAWAFRTLGGFWHLQDKVLGVTAGHLSFGGSVTQTTPAAHATLYALSSGWALQPDHIPTRDQYETMVEDSKKHPPKEGPCPPLSHDISVIGTVVEARCEDVVVGDLTLAVDVAFVFLPPSMGAGETVAHDGLLRDYSRNVVRMNTTINPAPGASVDFSLLGTRTAAPDTRVISLDEIKSAGDNVAVHTFGARSGYREGYYAPDISWPHLCSPVGTPSRNVLPVHCHRRMDCFAFPGDSGALVWRKADGAFLGVQSLNAIIGNMPCSFVALGCVWCGPCGVGTGGAGGSLY